MGRRDPLAVLLRRTFVVSHEESTRRHLVLLVALIVAVVCQPLLAHRSALAAGLFNAAFGLIYFYVLFVVFGAHRQRRIAYGLFLPAMVANFAVYAVPTRMQTPAAVVFHCTVLVFLGYTVTSILRDLFGRSSISGDDVLGAVCGYLLGGLAWAHVYAIAYVTGPGAFSVAPAIAPQLEDLHLRQALFNYFSFTTLTTIGYSDIIPVGPPAYSLVWLEVAFGQFYMAVVVAQLVGLKLAQAVSRDNRP